MASKDCIAAIAGALGRPPTEDEIERIAEAVQQRLKNKMARGMTPREAAREAGAEMSVEAKTRAALAKRTAYNNLLVHADLKVLSDRLGPARAEVAMLDGTERGSGRGAADSVRANHFANKQQLLAPPTVDLRKAGLSKVMQQKDPAFERDVARELRRLDDPTLEKDTGNKHAKEAARILGNVMEASRAMLNKAGAFISKAEGYMGRQTHDVWKIMKDQAGWMDQAQKSFDLEKMYPDKTPAQIATDLDRIWKALATGVHDSFADGGRGGYNMASKASAERSIHFKDADGWVDYNRKFGKGGVMDAIYAHADAAARDSAIMQKLGTNPQAMFDRWHEGNVTALRDAGKLKDAVKLDTGPNKGLLELALGSTSRPIDHTVAAWGATLRNAMQLKSLGGVLLSTLPDVFINAGMLRHHGIPYWQGVMGQIRAFFPQGERRLEFAAAMGAGIDGATGHIIHRFRVEDGVQGHMAGAVNEFHKWSGLTWETDGQKRGAGLAISHNLAYHADKEFGSLDPMLQATMRRYGIEAKEWDVARAARQVSDDKRGYILPGDIADKAVSQKVWTLITDQISEGMSEPTLTTRRNVTGGTQSGTYHGELIRSLLQFKGFTMSFMERTGGRTLLRGDGPSWYNRIDYPGAVYMIAGLTLAGLASNALRDVVANRTPASPHDANSWAKFVFDGMASGGAAGLYGDLVFRTGAKSSGDVLKQMTGPLPSMAADVAASAHSFMAGSSTQTRGAIAKKEAVQLLAHNVPGIPITVPFAKAAVDYLILHFLTEAVSPGSVARHDRALRQAGQDYILRP